MARASSPVYKAADFVDSRLTKLYRDCPALQPDYVREVLNLDGEQAARVGTITGGIHEDEAELLARLTAEANPATSLEIGLGYGFSALAICASGSRPSTERRHVVIDPHQTRHWGGVGMRHLAEAGFAAMIDLREDFSYRVLPVLEREGLEVDLAFIDGWHTFDFVFVDFFYVDKMLRTGGVVAFDDADWPSIRTVIRYAVTNLAYGVVATLPEKKERAPIDVRLGLEGSCIALRKPAPRRRAIFFHEEFT